MTARPLDWERKQTMTNPIAFDAAKRTGWAYRVNGAWRTGVIDPRDTAALSDLLRNAITDGVTSAAVEEPYCGVNVRTLKVIQECATRVQVACEMAGLRVERVFAQSWQAAYGITGERADRKRGAMVVARWLGADPKTQDEADAICLCDYASNHQGANHE